MSSVRRSLALALLLAPLLAGDAPTPAADLLPAKSRWTGTEEADKSHARSEPRAARLQITARDDKTFEAEFFLADDGLKLKGTVAADGTIDCVPTAVIRGRWQRNITDDHWHGVATATELTLTRKLSANGGEKTMTLARAAEAARPGKRRGK